MQRMWSTYLDPSGLSNGRGSPSPQPQPVHGSQSNALQIVVDQLTFAIYSVRSQFHSLYARRHEQQQRCAPRAPNVPFASRASSFRSMSPKNDTPLISDGKGMPTSLSVNYLPSKFSNTMLAGGVKRRKGKNAGMMLPKRGGGREAFRSNEARMPGDGDDDYDGVTFGARDGGKTKPRLRWNRFKWILFISNIVFSAYSLVGLIACLLIWFDVWTHADIIRVGNRPELIISTVAASLAVFTSLIGWSGILLKTAPSSPGMRSYFGFVLHSSSPPDTSPTSANQLGCCGYFNPFVEATVSQTCYARSTLPGCKKPYLDFERLILERWYTVVFSVVPGQLAA
ncbi:hypothetical protein A0H81_14827 [Grifola frondosa]|uniref:Uncharacterized protein n=1 Tax=Grifola frondosa TaxID=5627 RepID=A0A1C7LK97_GRIFR|nr:hypothetical protein A0H81_14827 [Grifola frondosa]